MVIAIIVNLAALLLPALGKSKMNAQQVNCLPRVQASALTFYSAQAGILKHFPEHVLLFFGLGFALGFRERVHLGGLSTRSLPSSKPSKVRIWILG